MWSNSPKSLFGRPLNDSSSFFWPREVGASAKHVGASTVGVTQSAEIVAAHALTMGIDTTFLRSRLDRLAACLHALGDAEDATAHRLTGEVCADYFEVALEQSGKLLRKCLRPWFPSNRRADSLTFRDIFRHAAKHGLIDIEAGERWLGYRDAADRLVDRESGDLFDAAALDLLRAFLADARALADTIGNSPRE